MKKTLPIYAVFITLFFLYANSGAAPNQGQTGAPGEGQCTGCHAPNNSGFEGSVTVRGLPENIMPSTTYNLSVSTKVTAGSPSRAGFQLAILDDDNNNVGSFNNTGASSGLRTPPGSSRTYFGHQPAQSFNNADSVEWTVEWTAPAMLPNDSIRVYVNSIIGNGSSGNSGDLMVSSRPSFGFQAAMVEPIMLTPTTVDANCFGDADGSASVVASGGVGDISFQWSNDSTGSTISNLSIGRYIVTATDSEGTTATATITINQPDDILIAIDSVRSITCIDTIGQARATASGGTAPYTYLWDTGDTTQLAALAAGMHSITITDANGCEKVSTVNIMEDLRAPIAFAGTDVLVTCADTNTTSVQLDAFNTTTGTGVSYLWTTSDGNISAGETTLAPTVTASGMYVLTVTNGANGCTAEDTVAVNFDLNPPVANAGTDQEIDCTNSTVTLDGSGSDQGDNITYSWTAISGQLSGGETSATATTSSAGTYVLTVTNTTTTCTASDTVMVTENIVLPQVDAGPDKQLGCTTTSVTLEATATVGDSITYLWTTEDGSFTDSDSLLTPTVDAAGTYILTVANLATGCSASDTVQVTLDNTVPQVTAGNDLTIGCGPSDMLQVVGNATMGDNIVYLWSTMNGMIDGDSTTLQTTIVGMGTYTLTATDTMTGCSASASFNVTMVTPPTADAGMGGTLDCVIETLTLDGSGSLGDNLLYEWTTNNGNIVSDMTTAMPTVDAAGEYILTVTDTVSGCSDTDTVSVMQAMTVELFAASGDAEQLTCAQSTITLNAMATEGDNIIYNWTTEAGNIVSGGNTLMPTIDAPGKYELTVTDTTTGCTAVSSIKIAQDVSLPTVSAGEMQELNCSETSVRLSGSSDTEFNLTYTWTTEDGNIVEGADTPMPLVSSAGTYILTVVDTFTQCANSDSVMVTADAEVPLVGVSAAEALDCDKDTITINGTGSTGDNLVNMWSTLDGNIIGDPTALDIQTDMSGSYRLTITDTISGCSNSADISIMEDRTEPMVDIQASNAVLCAGSTVTLNGTPANSDATFDYVWLSLDGNFVDGDSMAMVTVNSAGTYLLTVLNTINGCVSMDTAIITEVEGITLSLDTMSAGSATVSAAGGTAPYAYLWNTDSMDTTPTITGQLAGDYTVAATDANGCTDELMVSIEISTSLADIERSIELLQIFPNPSNDLVNINLQFNTPQAGRISIRNAVGQQVWQQNFDQREVQQTVLVNDWSAGIYYLMIQTAEGVKTEEMVVIR
ncbi:MAG: T9SS type A sorting domain-containing protein [Bacteroidota bacterium]